MNEQNSGNNNRILNLKRVNNWGRGLLSGKCISGSRFGASLANIGDIQKDGFEDFVVGSPYDGEDHSGAIYVYRGVVDNFGSGQTVLSMYRINFQFNIEISKTYSTIYYRAPSDSTKRFSTNAKYNERIWLYIFKSRY